MGSKSQIAGDIIKFIPKADNFYDLFGGGFSITHAMIIRRGNHFKEFHFNDINSSNVDLIKKAIHGDFSYKVFLPKWISRDEFFKNLHDPYTRICWSFGNNQKDYLYGKEIEPYKRSMHQAIVFNEFDELASEVLGCTVFKDEFSIAQRRSFLRGRIDSFKHSKFPDLLKPYIKNQHHHEFEQIQALKHLEALDRLQQLQRLEQCERLNFYSESYDQIKIKPNSVVYCDPPYKGTADYGDLFNTEKFLDWAASHEAPIFISEYNIDDRRFRLVKVIEKRSLLGSSRDIKKEKIYINKSAVKKLGL